MNVLAPFIYGDQPVRVVTIDGEPWFVLADLCRVLDLSNTTMVADRLDADALGTAEVIDSMGRTQSARIVSEPGMYAVVFMSRKPEAATFRRWVTTDVLPANPQARRLACYWPGRFASMMAAITPPAPTAPTRSAMGIRPSCLV